MTAWGKTMSEPTGTVRVRIIGQASEQLFVELLMPDWPPETALDIEMLYPSGETVRYSREVD